MVWVGSSSGEFSVKSVWELIRHKRSTSLVDDFIWTNLVPLKLSFFAWKALRNLVPLDVALKRRGISLASRCSCCLSREESLDHLFVTGPVAREVWSSFRRRFGILDSPSSSVSAMVVSWFTSTSLVTWDHIRTVIPLVILWFLWKSRNKACFEETNFGARRVISLVDGFVQQLGVAGKFSAGHFRGAAKDPWVQLCIRIERRRYAHAVSWKRPPLHHVKLNTDTSVFLDRAHRDGLLRDSEGRLIFAYYKEFGEIDVLRAESASLLYGL
ncbi:uncharacterized protein [Coffea arabica]|uniref:Reverse transcriptase zinc-binding domain-containing protein n=1 Tax=Coffea arabica TaxID=13443 RepID=A0ABM4UQV2_COFAR